jgi:signal peptidase I
MRPFVLGLAAGTLLVALALRKRFALVTVTGDSMMPTLAPGDHVLVRRVRISRLRRGQVVVMEAPGIEGYRAVPHRVAEIGRGEWIIKRVAAVPGDPRPDGSLPATAGPPGRLVPPGRFVVLGDNAAWSHDSRHIGYIPGDRLLGIAVRRIGSDGTLTDVVCRSPAAAPR